MATVGSRPTARVMTPRNMAGRFLSSARPAAAATEWSLLNCSSLSPR